MKYTQYRIAKRSGEIILQARRVTLGDSRRVHPWWKIWNWEFTYDKEYTEWIDVEIPEVSV